MNCREANLVLDTHAPEALTSTQRAAVDAHLASCEDCRADWANWQSVAALAIPPIPPELLAKITASLPAKAARNASASRRHGRVFVVGGLMVAGAALAAALALRNPREPQPEIDETSARSAPTIEETLSGEQATPFVAEPDATSQEVAAERDPDFEADVTFEGGLDPRSVVVLARPETIAGAGELEEFARCHAAIVAELEGIVGLNIIAGERVSSFDRSVFGDREVAQALGAGNVLEVSTENGCNARLSDSRSGARIDGATYGGQPLGPNGWSGFARTVASQVSDALLRDPAARVIEAQATVLNTALSDGQRIYALRDLRDLSTPIPGAFDSAVIAAAAQIGLSSPDASARESAWVNLRHVDDPYLIQPLLQSLANDPEADVRMQAALTLNTFLDEPGVREALARAAAEDPSAEPIAICCVPTVRDAAEWASVSTEDLPGWARGKLLDENLPTRSRLLCCGAGMPDGRFVRIADLGDDVPAVVFDIGRNETVPRLRGMAWSALGDTRHTEFVPVLLEDLKNHPDEYVRRSAAIALLTYFDLPEVRAAFEAAGNDPSMEVRRIVRNGMAQIGR